MKSINEAYWEQQKAELLADEIGQAFLAFLETWVEEAEAALMENTDDETLWTAAEAIRTALAPTEQKLGRITIAMVGQLLVVITTFWQHGDALADGLTPIEMRLLQDTLMVKIAALQAEAEATKETHDDQAD